MTFNSLNYFLFFLLIYLAYMFLSHPRQNILLLLASYFFYATWDIRFLFLVIVSTAVNYGCGIMMRDGKMSKRERAIASAWVILSFFFFIVVQWNYSAIPHGFFVAFLDWGAVKSWNEGWNIFLAVSAIILLCNLLYSKVVVVNEKNKRNFFLVIGVSTNLLILGYFKYCNFFIQNIEWLLKGFGLDPSRFHLNIILPIGISFYTFKGIGYIVDVYRGEIDPAHRYTDFALFIAFFPALLAGPIDRAKTLLPQLSAKRKLTVEQTIRGLHLIFYGLFKKVVIADGVVRTVNAVFGSTGQMSWFEVVVAALLFTLQVYCDFSGYTDVARGTANLFGIDLMVNFRLPYFSRNPSEFWSRWHISLSTWLRDYLYIPLGGNRDGVRRTYRNLLITMVLGGLWHGAAWNFVLWGLYQGIILCGYRALATIRSAKEYGDNRIVFIAKLISFFLITSYGWLLFRSPSLDRIWTFTSTLILDFGNLNFGVSPPRAAAIFGIPVFLCIEVMEYLGGGRIIYEKLPVPIWTPLYACMVFCLAMGMTTESAQFIYFKF